ncbi:MAG: DUF3021 domain-containing protein [Clostridia bacterium]|nr:DUF3021 domain-containing protein [Clostridia bacterium]
MSKKIWALVERWLTIKIGVEIRCCLTFFLMMFFYCVHRLLGGMAEANIWHIAQMILIAYLFGWVQALLHADFDEMDGLGLKEWAVLILGAAAYALTAWLGQWFGQSVAVTFLFLIYMIGCGLCTMLIYWIKRTIDARLLNAELKEFQCRREE